MVTKQKKLQIDLGMSSAMCWPWIEPVPSLLDRQAPIGCLHLSLPRSFLPPLPREWTRVGYEFMTNNTDYDLHVPMTI